MANAPWMFEPCDPEGARDPAGIPWGHAVRGVRPMGHVQGRVNGYGHTEPAAYHDAEQKARIYDAQDVLDRAAAIEQPDQHSGERGELSNRNCRCALIWIDH